MQAAQLLDLIKGRRSVRKFSAQPVDEALIADILEAGRGAPSGQNNQAWRFLVVRGEALKERIAQCTKYGAVVRGAPVLIPVFIHRPSMYNEVKDHQAVGACLQNMLLMIHGLGLGGVWLGEILNQAENVRQILGLPAEYELMAVLALGWPAATNQKSQRKPLSELLLGGTGS
ncbi:MAG: nitroreductase [Desulfarculus sp.]|nr:nitroreductase [Desulfarculus sp.]